MLIVNNNLDPGGRRPESLEPRPRAVPVYWYYYNKCTCIYIYIYIYIFFKYVSMIISLSLSLYLSLSLSIYIYIYICARTLGATQRSMMSEEVTKHASQNLEEYLRNTNNATHHVYAAQLLTLAEVRENIIIPMIK